jgi:hypothetical protein
MASQITESNNSHPNTIFNSRSNQDFASDSEQADLSARVKDLTSTVRASSRRHSAYANRERGENVPVDRAESSTIRSPSRRHSAYSNRERNPVDAVDRSEGSTVRASSRRHSAYTNRERGQDTSTEQEVNAGFTRRSSNRRQSAYRQA